MYTVKFLEKIQKMIEVFDSHVLNTKVVNYEAELDGLPFVAPETKSGSHFIVNFS